MFVSLWLPASAHRPSVITRSTPNRAPRKWGNDQDQKLPRQRLRSSVPSMKPTRRCKFSGEAGRSNPEQTARRRSGESRPTARPALKEAGSEIASRRTETGYEALLSRASGLVTAKLSRPKAKWRRSGGCARKVECSLPGEISPCGLKGRRREAAREVSRGRSTDGKPAGATERRWPEASLKERTERMGEQIDHESRQSNAPEVHANGATTGRSGCSPGRTAKR